MTNVRRPLARKARDGAAPTQKTQSVDVPNAASSRLELTSVDDYVDQLMEEIGTITLDLSDPKQRERFQGWLRASLSRFVNHLTWDVIKGAERGIRQVLTLVGDPDYYRLASARRQKRRQQWTVATPKAAVVTPPDEFLTDKGIVLATLQYGIYHVDTLADPGWQRSLIGEATTLEDANTWLAQRFGPQSRDEQLRETGSNRVEIVRMDERRIVAKHAVARGWKWTR